MISRKKANSLGRKIHKGSMGGKYIVIKGQKKYLTKKSNSTTKRKNSSTKKKKSKK